MLYCILLLREVIKMIKIIEKPKLKNEKKILILDTRNFVEKEIVCPVCQHNVIRHFGFKCINCGWHDSE